ncbi:outer membrane efflux protein [Prevotella sp. CAG:617]|nr:outer membrane efflux protein [Prevotella sp. CAG:617]
MKFWKNFKHFLTGFILLAPLPAATQPRLLLSVDSLLQLGMTQNVQLRILRQQEEMARSRAKTARTAKLPEVQVGLKGGYLGQPIVFREGLSHPTRPQSPHWLQNYEIALSQPIYQGGRIRYSIEKADIEQKIAELQTLQNEADIKLALLEQYMQLFSLYKQQTVLARNIEESTKRLENIKSKKRQGLITNNDVLRSELQLTNDRLALQEVDNSLTLMSQQLDILLGLDEQTLIVPDTTLLRQINPTSDYADYLQKAYRDDWTMRRLRQEAQLALNNQRLVKAEFLPQLSLYAGNTLARPITRTMADYYNNSWNIGLTLSYPLSSLYKNRHKLEEARLNIDASQQQEELRKQSLRMEIRTALIRHQEAQDRVKALELSVRQARENYRIMRNRYFGQLSILTDLLDANSVLLDAELQLTTARARVIYTYYELQKACGLL